MSDYIDRDLLLAEIKELKKSPWYNGCGENYERIIRSDAIGVVVDLCIKSAPAVDVQKIKHGEWTKDDSGSCYCSACGWYADYDYDYVTYVTNNGLGNGDFNYCPHCGAKMDGGNNNA